MKIAKITGSISFTRKALDAYKSRCEKHEELGDSTFIWMNQVNKVSEAKELIDKLEKSPNLSIHI
jgi:hypothetical protein